MNDSKDLYHLHRDFLQALASKHCGLSCDLLRLLSLANTLSASTYPALSYMFFLASTSDFNLLSQHVESSRPYDQETGDAYDQNPVDGISGRSQKTGDDISGRIGDSPCLRDTLWAKADETEVTTQPRPTGVVLYLWRTHVR